MRYRVNPNLLLFWGGGIDTHPRTRAEEGKDGKATWNKQCKEIGLKVPCAPKQFPSTSSFL